MNKEEIKNKIASDNNFDSFERAIRYTFNRELLFSEEAFINKLFDEAMQDYSDQENARLKAVVSKYEERDNYLFLAEGMNKSHQTAAKNDLLRKVESLESELSKLKAE